MDLLDISGLLAQVGPSKRSGYGVFGRSAKSHELSNGSPHQVRALIRYDRFPVHNLIRYARPPARNLRCRPGLSVHLHSPANLK